MEYDIDSDDAEFLAKLNGEPALESQRHRRNNRRGTRKSRRKKSETLSVMKFEHMIEELERECFVAEQAASIVADERRLKQKRCVFWYMPT